MSDTERVYRFDEIRKPIPPVIRTSVFYAVEVDKSKIGGLLKQLGKDFPIPEQVCYNNSPFLRLRLVSPSKASWQEYSRSLSSPCADLPKVGSGLKACCGGDTGGSAHRGDGSKRSGREQRSIHTKSFPMADQLLSSTGSSFPYGRRKAALYQGNGACDWVGKAGGEGWKCARGYGNPQSFRRGDWGVWRPQKGDVFRPLLFCRHSQPKPAYPRISRGKTAYKRWSVPLHRLWCCSYARTLCDVFNVPSPQPSAVCHLRVRWSTRRT